MAFALALVQLLNLAGPSVAEIILLIRKKDGTIAVMPILDEADKQYDANIKQAADWLRDHPITTPHSIG